MKHLKSIHKQPVPIMEYSRQLVRLCFNFPNDSVKQIAKHIGKSESFVRNRLSLLEIKDKLIRERIDRGIVKLKDAYKLAAMYKKDIKVDNMEVLIK